MAVVSRRLTLAAAALVALLSPVAAYGQSPRFDMKVFLGTMNELILAQNLLRGSEGSYTLAVGLSGFVNQGFESRWGPFSAGSLIGAIPAIIVFFLAQRYIVSGLTSGAVKG